MRWVLLSGIWLLIVLFELIGINAKITTAVGGFTKPILRAEVRVASNLTAAANNVKTWYVTARRVQDLEIKLANALARLSELDQLKTENAKLRELLNSSNRTLEPVVISTPVLSLAQPAIGLPAAESSLDLIRPGSPVLVQRTLVGIVSELGQNIAYVDLLWQKDTRPVLAETNAGVQGIVTGDGKRVLLTEVPTEQELEIGQRVTTSGQEGINKGLYIGEIQSIQSGDSAAVKTAVIQQYVSFFEADIVEIR